MSGNKKSNYVAYLHLDFVLIAKSATNDELAEFIRAQISQYEGVEINDIPSLSKALLDVHNMQQERFNNISKIRQEAGMLGGNPLLVNQSLTKAKPKVNQRLSRR